MASSTTGSAPDRTYRELGDSDISANRARTAAVITAVLVASLSMARMPGAASGEPYDTPQERS